MATTVVSGFSKFSKEEKIQWLSDAHFNGSKEAIKTLQMYWNSDSDLQKLHDEFIENTVSNYYLPFGVAPNFLINDKQLVFYEGLLLFSALVVFLIILIKSNKNNEEAS